MNTYMLSYVIINAITMYLVYRAPCARDNIIHLGKKSSQKHLYIDNEPSGTLASKFWRTLTLFWRSRHRQRNLIRTKLSPLADVSNRTCPQKFNLLLRAKHTRRWWRIASKWSR